jgi:hypothetical protein
MIYTLSKVVTAFLGVCFAMSGLATQPASGGGSGLSQPGENQWSLLELPKGARPVKVHAEFHLLDIQKINDEEETFEFSGVLTLTWQDERQRFDPVAEGVEEIIYNGSYQFNELAPAWYPQAVLTNASEVQEIQGVLLRVRSDGTSRLVQTVNAVARSELKLQRYPFDRQRLEAVFEILGFDDSEVALESGNASVTRSKIVVPEWDFIDIATLTRLVATPYAGAKGSSSAFVVNLVLDRQPFFMLRLVVFPLLVIMMLSWSVFWMDRSSLGDRMSVSFVGILTAVAYQTSVSSIMPQISYMTMIHGFLYVSFLLMCATVIVNLVVGTCDRQGDFKRGDVIDRQCRWIFPSAFVVLIFVVVAIAYIWF